jgi:hypothetical protein
MIADQLSAISHQPVALGADDLGALMEDAGFDTVTTAPGPDDGRVVLVGRRSPIDV